MEDRYMYMKMYMYNYVHTFILMDAHVLISVSLYGCVLRMIFIDNVHVYC